jgi:hypothetical protein
MNLSAIAFVAFLTGAFIGCTSALDIHTIQSPSAHFAQYRTVAFDVSLQAPSKYEVSPRSADVRDHVQQAAENILQRQGYVVATKDGADLVVRIEAGRREHKVPVTTGIMPLGGGVAGTPAPGGAGGAARLSATSGEGNVAGPAEIATTYHGQLDQEEMDLVEGAFVIDVFDRKTRELVWHGFARSEINPGPVDYDRVRRAAESVLASFPAAATGRQ